MAAPISEKTVKLGFLEEIDSQLLKSHFFPSKVGGRPAWLSLDQLPDPSSLQCSECNGVTRFLMQVYAPLQSRDDTFHRTLFVFICPNPPCSSKSVTKSFKVIRSQLPLLNDFYSKEPPSEEIPEDFDSEQYPHAGKFHPLCKVCGVKGPKKCSQCKKASYCSKSHQVIDWKTGHKKECCKENKKKTGSGSQAYESELFKEFELVTEDEVLPAESNNNNSKSEEECLREYERLMESQKFQSSNEVYQLEELEKTAKGETEEDKAYLKFKERVRTEPSQVLRYCRTDEPLWVSLYQRPAAEDIPNCPLCGASRVFEFQIMPQLLNHLDLDRLEASVDWGTLCVYTCADSCSIGNTYREEFIWKQDFYNPDE